MQLLELGQFFGVTPNEAETGVTPSNRTPNQAGDCVHIGYYIDALAIDYAAGDNTAAAGQQPKP